VTTSDKPGGDFFKSLTFLGALPDEARAQLLKRGRMVRFGPGQTIYRRGDAGDSLMIIVSGRVKISNTTANAREIVLNFLGPGDVAGEIAALDGEPRTADAIAIEATQAFQLTRSELRAVLSAHPQAMLSIIEKLCAKLRATSAMAEEGLLPMSGRCASGLLRLASQHGRKCEDGILIDLAVSQRDLGNYLGLARENTNRQLGVLKDSGLIRTEGNRILILDLEALQEIAEAE
jgi:CRP-like cAMP-binding protein